MDGQHLFSVGSINSFTWCCDHLSTTLRQRPWGLLCFKPHDWIVGCIKCQGDDMRQQARLGVRLHSPHSGQSISTKATINRSSQSQYKRHSLGLLKLHNSHIAKITWQARNGWVHNQQQAAAVRNIKAQPRIAEAAQFTHSQVYIAGTKTSGL